MTTEEDVTTEKRVIRRLLGQGDSEALALIGRYQQAVVEWQGRATKAEAELEKVVAWLTNEGPYRRRPL